MEYVYLVILLALLEYIVLSGLVGYARGKYGIRAPATTGHEAFERVFRVQQNTLEGLIVFLPALWLFGTLVNPIAAAVIGFIGVIGRAIYAGGYMAASEKRAAGAMICGFVNVLLVLGALSGTIQSLL